MLHQVGPALEMYQSVLAESRVAVEVGKMYRTHDASLVFVMADENGKNACQCPACRVRRGEANAPTPLHAVLMGLLGHDAQPEETQESREDSTYLAVVLKGGHGFKKLSGEKPGEAYRVNSRGHTVLGDRSSSDGEGRAACLTPELLGLLGLSLKEEVPVPGL